MAGIVSLSKEAKELAAIAKKKNIAYEDLARVRRLVRRRLLSTRLKKSGLSGVNLTLFFNIDGRWLERYALIKGYGLMFFALHYTYYRLRGQKRKDGTPEITHSFNVCLDLLLHMETAAILGYVFPPRFKEIVLTIAILHDLKENAGVSGLELEQLFGKRVAECVDTLSRRSEEESEAYYARINKCLICILVKGYDKKSVMRYMSVDLPLKRQLKQIAEAKKFMIPMLYAVVRKKLLFADEGSSGQKTRIDVGPLILSCADRLNRLVAKSSRHAELEVVYLDGATALKERMAELFQELGL